MGTKEALIRAIDGFIGDLDRIDDWFEPSSRKSSRDFVHWGAIDFIAHSAFFVERRHQLIENPTDVEQLGDFEQALRSVFDRHIDSTWDEVTTSLGTALDRLKNLTEKRNDGELDELDSDDQPLWRGIAFYGILHSSAHITQAMIRAGSTSDAVSLQRRVTESLKEINDSDRWVGIVDFNFAKILTLAGDKNAAAVARGAIALYPDLKSRAESDPDFEKIRNEI